MAERIKRSTVVLAKGRNRIIGHSRSPILLPMESVKDASKIWIFFSKTSVSSDSSPRMDLTKVHTHTDKELTHLLIYSKFGWYVSV